MIPRQRQEPVEYDDEENCPYTARAIPMVDAVNDVLSPLTANTVLMILRGDAKAFGLGAHYQSRELMNEKQTGWRKGIRIGRPGKTGPNLFGKSRKMR